MDQPPTTADYVRALAVELNDAKLDAHSLNWRELLEPVDRLAVFAGKPYVADRLRAATDVASFRLACAEAVLDLHRYHPGVLG